MDFDDLHPDDLTDMLSLTEEQLEWHQNIFKFVNPRNILYIPDQHYLV